MPLSIAARAFVVTGRLIRWFAIAVPIGIAVLLLALWLEHRTELTLPQPTGFLPVGRTTLVWINPAKQDELSPPPHTNREVLVWIWYPSTPSRTRATADYLPPAWTKANARVAGRLMTEFLTRDFSMVRTHSSPEADVSPMRSWPVLIVRPGGGALTVFFTTLAEDLASLDTLSSVSMPLTERVSSYSRMDE